MSNKIAMTFFGVIINSDRHHCFNSGNIKKTEGGQIHLNFMTIL